MAELSFCEASLSFRDIRGYRHCCPSDLRSQSKTLNIGERFGFAINPDCHIPRLFPNQKFAIRSAHSGLPNTLAANRYCRNWKSQKDVALVPIWNENLDWSMTETFESLKPGSC